MRTLTSPRPRLPRATGVCAALALLGLLGSACSDSGTQAGGTTETQTETGDETQTETGDEAQAETGGESTASGFCSHIDGIGAELALVNMTETEDAAAVPDLVSSAAERFSTVEPPEQIRQSWQRVGEFFMLADEALAGVDVNSAADIEDALQFEGEEDFAMVLTLPGQMELVGAFVQEECGVDLGITAPVVTDVCSLVDTVHLTSVFPNGTVPEGENMPWGQGSVECTWDDSDGHEVGIVVLPASTMESDLLSGQEPIETSNFDDIEIGVYDGAIGPFRAASGRTAAAVIDDTGVMVSVSGEDSNAEANKAIALVGLVAAELP